MYLSSTGLFYVTADNTSEASDRKSEKVTAEERKTRTSAVKSDRHFSCKLMKKNIFTSSK